MRAEAKLRRPTEVKVPEPNEVCEVPRINDFIDATEMTKRVYQGDEPCGALQILAKYCHETTIWPSIIEKNSKLTEFWR